MNKYITLRMLKHRAKPTKKAEFLGYTVVIVNGWKNANKLAKKLNAPFIRVSDDPLRDDLRKFINILQEQHPFYYKKLMTGVVQ